MRVTFHLANWCKFSWHRTEVWLEVPVPSPFEYVGLFECAFHYDNILMLFGLQFQWSSW